MEKELKNSIKSACNTIEYVNRIPITFAVNVSLYIKVNITITARNKNDKKFNIIRYHCCVPFKKYNTLKCSSTLFWNSVMYLFSKLYALIVAVPGIVSFIKFKIGEFNIPSILVNSLEQFI